MKKDFFEKSDEENFKKFIFNEILREVENWERKHREEVLPESHDKQAKLEMKKFISDEIIHEVEKRETKHREEALPENHDVQIDLEMKKLKEEIEEVKEKLLFLQKEFFVRRGSKINSWDFNSKEGDTPVEEEFKNKRKNEEVEKDEVEKGPKRSHRTKFIKSKSSPGATTSTKKRTPRVQLENERTKSAGKNETNVQRAHEKYQLNFSENDLMVTGPATSLRKDLEKINEVIRELRKINEGKEQHQPLTTSLKSKIMDLMEMMNENLRRRYEEEIGNDEKNMGE